MGKNMQKTDLFLTAQITNLFSLKGRILLSVMFLKVVGLQALTNLPLDCQQ